jgi:hypothetical protein
MSRGTHVDFNRTNLSIENSICEIIDNCRDSLNDAGKKRIHLVFEQGQKNTEIQLEYPTCVAPNLKDYSKSFSIAIYDEGDGFVDENELHEAFEIIQTNPKPRGKGHTGKFHLGMKEASLNRFHHFSLITKIKSDVKIRSIFYPGEQNSRVYDWEKSGPKENPTDSLPNHLNLPNIKAYMKKEKMITCALLSAARFPMTDATGKKGDFSKLDDFITHMKHFIGVAYHKDLVKGTLEIGIRNSTQKIQTVEPVDLFWSEATPTAIKAYPKKNSVTKNQQYICNEMFGYGILSGVRQKAQVMINGQKNSFYVTPYLVPSDEARTELMKVTTKWDKSRVVDISPPVVSSSGKLFTAQNLQGYTFVRNGRAIIIGNMKNAENYGFYNGISMIESTTKARVRIKIEYESHTGSLDSVFRILPNKDGYQYIDQKVWDAIYTVLTNKIDGNASKNFFPHNKNGPFYENGNAKTRHFNNGIGLSKKNDWCKECNKVYHKKGRKCPERPCAVCKKQMNKKSCTVSLCGNKCTICGKKGHLKTNCPTSKCVTCGNSPCICCPTCKKVKCTCPSPACPTCGKSPCACPCPPFKAVPIGPSAGGYGDEYSVDYCPSQKTQMIALIKKLMKDSKIKKSDL